MEKSQKKVRLVFNVFNCQAVSLQLPLWICLRALSSAKVRPHHHAACRESLWGGRGAEALAGQFGQLGWLFRQFYRSPPTTGGVQ